jgi:hypothetical protein
MVAKKTKEEIKEEPVEVPSISFTEKEVQAVADFINYCYQKAEFKGSMTELAKVNKMFSEMHGHVSKIEGYILDYVKVIQKPKGD